MWERWREGLTQGSDPDVPREGGNECAVHIHHVLGLPPGLPCFHRPSPQPGGSVFTHHQQVVTCPKTPQASERQSRGSHPEPVKAVLRHASKPQSQP